MVETIYLKARDKAQDQKGKFARDVTRAMIESNSRKVNLSEVGNERRAK